MKYNGGEYKQAKFIFASMYGTYWMDCEILEEKNGLCKVKYFDPFVEEIYEKTVPSANVSVFERKVCEHVKS